MVGIGLFAPLPLAVMIPFMAGQSFAMGEAFGKGFQFGKRKISSMSNEDFNKLTGPQAFAETTADITKMIPSMSTAMQNFHLLQTDIIKQMISYIAQLPKDVIPSLLTELITPVPNPSGLWHWSDLFDFFKTLFGSDAATLKFLEENGLSASGQPITNDAFEKLRIIANLTTPTTEDQGPPAPAETQEQMLQKYTTYPAYRSAGGLLLEATWRKKKGLDEPPFVPPVIFTVTLNWVLTNALGRIIKRSGFYQGYTNPQRNGSWRIKVKLNNRTDALAWLNKNWPSSTHGQYTFLNNTEDFKVRKSDIVKEQNKLT